MRQRALLLLISLSFSGLVATAQDVSQTRAFADSLFSAGHALEALPAYERAAYFMRPDIDAVVLERIADCNLAAGKIETALEYYDHSYFAQTNDSIKKELIFKKSACFIRSHNYKFALMELLSMDTGLDSRFDQKKNFYLGMTWFGMEDYAKSETFFENAVTGYDNKLKIRTIFADPKRFQRPNPKAASWLSIFIPGSGQIYSGEVVSGINSLLLTGSFLALGFYLASVTTVFDAIITALPWFQRYYQGGFQRAAEMAKNKREDNRNKIFNQVLDILADENL